MKTPFGFVTIMTISRFRNHEFVTCVLQKPTLFRAFKLNEFQKSLLGFESPPNFELDFSRQLPNSHVSVDCNQDLPGPPKILTCPDGLNRTFCRSDNDTYGPELDLLEISAGQAAVRAAQREILALQSSPSMIHDP
jgi:hypothetical protein